MAIIKQHDKRSGITYVYESKSFWDPERKTSRSKRKLIGKIDPETGEMVPTDGRMRKASKRKEEKAKTFEERLAELEKRVSDLEVQLEKRMTGLEKRVAYLETKIGKDATDPKSDIEAELVRSVSDIENQPKEAATDLGTPRLFDID